MTKTKTIHTKRAGIILAVAFAVLAFYSTDALSTTYYVKPTGNDNNSGLTDSQAWQHVQKACATLVAGDTVFIRGGYYKSGVLYSGDPAGQGASAVFRYDENSALGVWWPGVNRGMRPHNSGTKTNPIVFKGYPGEPPPIILGSRQGVNGQSTNRSPAELSGLSYITFDSLHFKYGYRGVHMSSGRGFTMRNCEVDSTVGPDNNNNGGFISFNSGFGALRDVVIENCHLWDNYDLDADGSSGYKTNNTSGIHIYDCDSCVFRDNVIHGQQSGIAIKGHYPSGTAPVGDSLKWVEIEGNTIYDNEFGIQLDIQGVQRYVSVHHNLIYDCRYNGIAVPAGGLGIPEITDLLIYNNTIDASDQWAGQLLFRLGNIERCSVFNNILVGTNPSAGSNTSVVRWKNEQMQPSDFFFDYNLYQDTDVSRDLWSWNDDGYYTFQEFKNLPLSSTMVSAQSVHAKVASLNSLFQNRAALNYRLDPSSPAATGGLGGAYPTYMGAFDPWGGSDPCDDDQSSPVISNIQKTNITSSSARITWTTNEPSNSRVDFGTSTSYTLPPVSNGSMVTSHSIDLTGLTQSTLYHFRVRSTDACGNERVGSDNTFTTQQADVNAPVISNESAIDLTTTAALITWLTNEPATSQVEWGLTASYGSATTVDNTLVTVHSVQLMGLQADTQYHYRVRSRDADGNERVGTDRVFETPGDGENLSLGLPPDVSGSYSGYTATTITDGVNDPYGGASSTWASDESPSLPHWVEIDMGVTRTVDRVAVCWAWNEFRDAWMTSQQYKIQAWNGSSYVDLATVTDPTAGAVTVRSFAPVYTDRIRIWQPANAGPPEYTSVMWLSELEVLQAGGADTIPPATIQDLR